MPPKSLFTREEIIEAALALTREGGLPALTARSLAARLGASVKPIFGLFRSMEEVQQEVLRAADALYQSYLAHDMAAGVHPPYKASGLAYIRFAREEKELFKLLFMRDRTGESAPQEDESLGPILALLQKNVGFTREEAMRFHVEMWVFTHGLAAMIATGYLNWEESFISQALSDMFVGLKRHFAKEETR